MTPLRRTGLLIAALMMAASVSAVFQIKQASLGQLVTEYGELPVMRLVATLNNRIEPITLLVRASSIDRDEKNAYGLQEGFLREMLAALPQPERARLAGRLGT